MLSYMIKKFLRRLKFPIISTPIIISLGNVPAYSLEVVNNDPLYYLNIINVLRINKIIAFPATEGREIAGFLENIEQVKVIQKFGQTTIGIPKEGTDSYLYYDQSKELGIIGCSAIIAAYRGKHLNKDLNAWQISDKKTRKIVGAKNTKLLKINEGDIFSGTDTYLNNKSIPPQVFHPIRRYSDLKSMETHYFKNGYAIKIDANNFSKNLLQTPRGLMKVFLKSYTDFFNKIEDDVCKISKDILVSERTTDSVEFYTLRKDDLYKISEVLELIQRDENFIQIKAVSHRIRETTLTSLNGRVLHSDKPVSKDVWRKKEEKIKMTQKKSKNHLPIALWDVD